MKFIKANSNCDGEMFIDDVKFRVLTEICSSLSNVVRVDGVEGWMCVEVVMDTGQPIPFSKCEFDARSEYHIPVTPNPARMA